MPDENDSVLAIDFGTSNSLVGAVINGKSVGALPIDPYAADPTLMRTLLYFPHGDLCYYGAEALSQYSEHDMEGRLFRSFKTHLANPSYAGSVIGNRILSIDHMVVTFLLELKKRAEKNLGQKVNRVVLGRPARYSMDILNDQLALNRMTKAAQFAGFTDIKFVPEPIAAAFDYRKKIKSEKIVLIGDFGGGTSDFTIVKLRPDGFRKDDVLAVEGCPLAGDSFDSLFMSERLNTQFGAKSAYRLPMSTNVLNMPPGIVQKLNHPAHIVHLKEKDTYEFIKEVRKCTISDGDKIAMDRLFTLIDDQQIFSFFEQIEQAKRKLSTESTARFQFDYPDLEIQTDFLLSEFVTWSQALKEKIFASLDRCLQEAQLTPIQIDLVCLTGGTAQVPLIKNEFILRFGESKLQMASQFHSVLSGLIESATLPHNET